MKQLSLLFFIITLIGCKTEQQKNDEISQKIIAVNWPLDPTDDTHYKVDTLKIFRIEKINPNVTIEAMISKENETIYRFNRRLKDEQTIYENLQPEIAKHTDKPVPEKIPMYHSFVRANKKIDSLRSLKLDTTSKIHYAILARMVISSNVGNDYYTIWLFTDSDYRIWYRAIVE